jgi:hypothetical protein
VRRDKTERGVVDERVMQKRHSEPSWPQVMRGPVARLPSKRLDTFLQTTSDKLEFLLDAKRRTIHFCNT